MLANQDTLKSRNMSFILASTFKGPYIIQLDKYEDVYVAQCVNCGQKPNISPTFDCSTTERG